MRVLFLASFFPKPGNPVMGTWALGQARAIARQPGVELRVVSFTSWVPKLLARSEGAKAYAHCPPRHDWGGLEVEYPRWLYYPIEPFKRWAYPQPYRQVRIAWRSAKGRLCRLVRDYKPDVIYCHHSVPNGYMAYQLSKLFPVPFIVTDHDFGEISDCQKFPHRRRVIERIANRATLMVAVARRMEESTKRLFPLARTCTIYNGITIPPETFRVKPAMSSPVFPAPPEAPPEVAGAAPRAETEGKRVVFSCGMFAPRKGFALLVEAFAKIADKHPDAVLRIAGDGEQRPLIEKTITRTGMTGRVQLIGRLPHEKVFAEMAACEFFALVGWDEPFATVYIEAMGCGKAIVTCSDGGINDVIADGVHGLSVQPRDVASAAAALDRLLSDPALCQTMGTAAQKLVEEKLTWDVNARQMVELFTAAAKPGSYRRKV